MDGVKVTGTFNSDVFFQTLGLIVARKHGIDISLRSRDKAEEWVNVFYRIQRPEKRTGA